MATKQFILLRHAKSDWSVFNQDDHDRALSTRGERDAPRVGKWFAQHDYRPDVILSSSSQRTRQTLDLVLAGARWNRDEIDIRFEQQLYLASGWTILDFVKSELQSVDKVMVVGHNPGMDGALMQCCHNVPRSSDGKLMTTASFAVLNCDDAELNDPQLVEFNRPRSLDI